MRTSQLETKTDLTLASVVHGENTKYTLAHTRTFVYGASSAMRGLDVVVVKYRDPSPNNIQEWSVRRYVTFAQQLSILILAHKHKSEK